MSKYFNNLRVYNAEQFKQSIVDGNAQLYLSFGKSDSWVDDNQPPAVTANVKSEYDIWYNMIGAKKIVTSDLRHVIPRINWSANTVYNQYDDLNEVQSGIYILTDDYNVYKCIDNKSNTKSTVKPTSINTSSVVTTSDGYTWKYMYTVNDEEVLRFLTTDYIPVKSLLLDDNSLQWQVQKSAKSGPIYSIKVTNPGQNYTNASNVLVSIFGDGSGAIASATINTQSNTIQSISMNVYGTNYTTATVRISGGGGSNATARAIITPIDGHGSNPVYELGASNILIDKRIIGSEQNKYPATAQYRQVALLKDPYKFGTKTISSNNVVSQTYKMSLYNYSVGVGAATDYNVNEIVYQGNTYSTSTFSARVVDWDSANNILVVSQFKGTANLIQSLTGLESSTTKAVGAVDQPELQPYSGQMLYVDNFTPITKDPEQIDDLKLVIKF